MAVLEELVQGVLEAFIPHAIIATITPQTRNVRVFVGAILDILRGNLPQGFISLEKEFQSASVQYSVRRAQPRRRPVLKGPLLIERARRGARGPLLSWLLEAEVFDCRQRLVPTVREVVHVGWTPGFLIMKWPIFPCPR